MKRNNISRVRVKKTSTPCDNNKGVLFSKTFENVSAIQNKYKGIRCPIIESPTLLDWEDSTTDDSKMVFTPSAELNKRRSDTPLKSHGNSRFSLASAACPEKLTFSSISNSCDIDSELSDIKKGYCKSANGRPLYTDRKRGSKNEERELANKSHNDALRSIKVGEKETKNTDSNYSDLGEQARGNIYEENGEELIKSPETSPNFKRTPVSQAGDPEADACNPSEFSNSSDAVITKPACDGSLGDIRQVDATRKNSDRKRKPKRRKNVANISRISVSERESFKGKCFGESKLSDDDEVEAIDDSFPTGTRRSGKCPVKQKRKLVKEQEQENKNLNEVQANSPVGELALQFDSTLSVQEEKEAAEVETLKTPLKTKNDVISKLSDRGGKVVKVSSLCPPTSTPLKNPAIANEKLPVEFESLSPVESSEKWDKNDSLYDIKITPIKARKTYAKNAKNDSRLDREIYNWECFIGKTTYNQRETVGETSLSKPDHTISIRLFESPLIGVNENTPPVRGGISNPQDKLRTGRASKSETGDRAAARKSNAKKLFQITNIRDM